MCYMLYINGSAYLFWKGIEHLSALWIQHTSNEPINPKLIRESVVLKILHLQLFKYRNNPLRADGYLSNIKRALNIQNSSNLTNGS